MDHCCTTRAEPSGALEAGTTAAKPVAAGKAGHPPGIHLTLAKSRHGRYRPGALWVDPLRLANYQAEVALELLRGPWSAHLVPAFRLQSAGGQFDQGVELAGFA